jgi:hypothetical protein
MKSLSTFVSTRPPAHKIIWGFFFSGVIVGAIALVRDTLSQGHDFLVFWQAARFVLSGEPAYSVARDGAMVFKYPPWILPAFFPFALLPEAAAKIAWGLSQVFCIFYCARWLVRQGLRLEVVCAMVALFWGLWAVHALDGQSDLLLMVLILQAGPLALWAYTAKIFTFFGALAQRAQGFSLKQVTLAASLFIVFSIPVYLVQPDRTPAGVIRDWAQAAGSGGQAFPDGKIRGRDNQGLPALALRAFRVPAEEQKADVLAFFGVAALFYHLAFNCGS